MKPTGPESSEKERVVIAHVYFSSKKMQEDLEEIKALVVSAGVQIVSVVTANKRSAEAKYFVGLGKAEELRDVVSANSASVVIFNHSLSPAQERNLEKLLQCRVIDRTGLILDIFAQRARSFEGKLQVELAVLSHLATRLVRGWTHLERQRGGIGLRGPGETQLETDRRLIKGRMKVIEKRLIKIHEQREQSRRARKKASVPTVALVGYTNAGKSTLFNRLTQGSVYVADQLFATLDPTLRRAELRELGTVVFADTVGFIRHLPHSLIKAFYATLEEVSEADLLLHVVDISDVDKAMHIEQVEDVLSSIGADKVPRLLVYNKIDAVLDGQPSIERNEFQEIRRVSVSSQQNLGMDLLESAIIEAMDARVQKYRAFLSPAQAKLRANLYTSGTVLAENIDENGNSYLTLRISKLALEKLFALS